MAVALLLAGLVLAVWELGWRSTGLTPSLGHGEEFWALRRAAVTPDAIVLVGTSRIQTDVDPEVLAAALGGPAVQLAILGTSPLPVLEDVVADPRFRGRVIVDLVPRVVFDATRSREAVAYQRLALLEEALRPSGRTESALRARLRRALVTQRPEFSLTALLTTLSRGRLPSAPFVTMEMSGFRRLDFDRTDGEERESALLRQIEGTGRPARPDELAEIFARLERSVDALRARGGAVVFVRLPSTKRIAAFEEAAYPRARYWHRFAAQTAAPAIHFADVPELSGWSCPDGSHLDYRDAPAFTRALAAEIARRLQG